ncbi:metallophosphoesterase family protein [Hirschia baltica]|uniref:Metallophosphoesterase n=1 Tax=Hirschia baltica (strain ATCC 49814 / DSM 5838 / IFAM 1418) TaxID=582402 RepID=C6XLC2_HIRBI|nr:metallophosphoesterase [Hirschia baltica]ACT59721.1 metallophosphoesterase [Hirschia baltica ATCC 49814]
MTVLVHMADLHLGTEDVRAMEIASREIKQLNPDAIIVAGDLTQSGKKSEFILASEWLSQFLIPKTIVPGNHDTPLINMFSRVVRPFGRFDRLFARHSNLQIDDTHIAGLNTARGWQVRSNWAEGSVNSEDLNEILDLQKVADQKLNIIACHHPFLPIPHVPMRTRTIRGRKSSEKIAARNGRSLMLYGHVHTPAAHRFEHGDGHYYGVTCGTLSTRTRNAPPSFNIINISDAEVEVQAISIDELKVSSHQLIRFSLEP